jgi:hypothetical protein
MVARCPRHERKRGHRMRTWNQDKGQRAAVADMVGAVRRGAPSPFSLDEIEVVSPPTFATLESVPSGRRVELRP